ncbi:YgjP-like metallopeptidase domain-containing protein [Spirosoma harenae]
MCGNSELCHTKVKKHSKEFWAELSRHVSNWKELDDQRSRYML